MSAKKQLLIFLVITFVISYIQEYFIYLSGGIESSWSAFALMWTPGFVGLILSWQFGHRFKDIGFKIGRFKYYAVAYGVPAMTAVLILGLLLIFNIGSYEINPGLVEKYGSVAGVLKKVLLYGPFVGALMGFVSGLGEEVGWRGFMQSRFLEAKIKHPFLIAGLIWSVWHWPLILFSDYATSELPLLSAAIFTVNITSFGIFLGWLRWKSGSIYPVALAHGIHNLWIQAIYPAFIKAGPLDPYFGGESGVFNAVIYLCLAIFLYRKYLKTSGSPLTD